MVLKKKSRNTVNYSRYPLEIHRNFQKPCFLHYFRVFFLKHCNLHDFFRIFFKNHVFYNTLWSENFGSWTNVKNTVFEKKGFKHSACAEIRQKSQKELGFWGSRPRTTVNSHEFFRYPLEIHRVFRMYWAVCSGIHSIFKNSRVFDTRSEVWAWKHTVFEKKRQI